MRLGLEVDNITQITSIQPNFFGAEDFVEETQIEKDNNHQTENLGGFDMVSDFEELIGDPMSAKKRETPDAKPQSKEIEWPVRGSFAPRLSDLKNNTLMEKEEPIAQVINEEEKLEETESNKDIKFTEPNEADQTQLLMIGFDEKPKGRNPLENRHDRQIK